MATSDNGLIKRSMRIAGHRTSVALESIFWDELTALAAACKTSVPQLIAAIDKDRASLRPAASLASALRVAVLIGDGSISDA